MKDEEGEGRGRMWPLAIKALKKRSQGRPMMGLTCEKGKKLTGGERGHLTAGYLSLGGDKE